MSTAQDKAEEAIASGKLEEEEVKTDDNKSDDKSKVDNGKKDDDKSKDDKGDDKSKSADDDSDKSDDKGDDDKSDDDKVDADKNEGKFTADDSPEVDDPAPADNTPTDRSGVQLSQAEQAHIQQNIGDPITIRGLIDDKPTEIKVYAPDQIPRNFTFQSDAERLMAQTSLSRLEQRAEQLLGNFRSDQSRQQTQDYDRRENESIRTDVADLQKDGEFPKFKLQPGSAGFDEDPAAQQMAEVLDVMSKKNEQFIAEYNQGRAYKHIGFREAFDIWQKGQTGRKQVADQKQEDQDRKKVADKVGNNRGLTAPTLAKARVKSGTRTSDILARIDAEDW